ncbi:MAG: DUF1365 domain-containing protein [Alphaproteobacteria bacterium]
MNRRALQSCFYFGAVMHRRLRPVRHRFAYRVFSCLIDLDELEALGRLRFFGHNRFNLMSFHDRDHGPRDGSPLRPWIEARLAGAGIDIAGGPVRLLCFPRVLGYVFNPLSIWFCYHADGRLRAILYEVSNTFGERHSYLILVRRVDADKTIAQSCAKAFHVSPFLPLAGRYAFRLRAPDARLAIVIREEDGKGPVMVAAQNGRRRPFTPATVLHAFVRYPLMTLKVIAAIHFEALRLWRKGARIHRRPTPLAQPVSVIQPADTQV